MKLKATFIASIVVVMLFAVAADAQNTNPSKPNPKITPKEGVGNPAKLPPTVSPVAFVPKLVFKSAEETVLNKGQKGTAVVLSIVNWPDFPAELFASTPNLPPDPCGPGWNYPQEVHQQRMLLTVYSRDKKQIYVCRPYPTTKSLGFIRFYLEQGKTLPPGLQVVLKDRLTGTTYASNVVSPSPPSK